VMREMKCRAFDDERKVFTRAKLIENESSNWIDERGFDVVWYTGLRDKEGTLIYDGDIVSTPSGTLADIQDVIIDGETYKAYKPNPPVNYIVSNRGYAFFLGTEKNPEYAGIINHTSNKKWHDITVIGNIHQHPELIKGE